MLKKMGIRGKMLLSICSVLLLSSLATISFITVKASNMARSTAEEKAHEISYKYGGMVKSEIDNAMDVARTVAHTFEGMKNSDTIPDRKVMDEILKQVLSRNPGIIAIDTCWEPDALDGRDSEFANTPGHDETGRYAPYWNRGSGRIEVEPLVNFDSEDWYQVPKRTGKEIFTEPYVYPVGGKDVLMATVVAPIKQNGRFLGMVAIDFALDAFGKMIEDIRPFGTGYGYLISNEGYTVAHPVKEAVGKMIQDSVGPAIKDDLSRAIKEGRPFTMMRESTGNVGSSYQVLTPIVIGQTDTPWSLGVVVPVDKIMEGPRALRNISVMIGIVSLLVICAVVYFISDRVVARPISSVVDSLKDIAEGEGDLTMRIDVRSSDEIGVLGNNFNVFAEKLQGMISEISQNAESMAGSSEGLLTVAGELSSLAGDTSDRSNTVSAAAEEMSSNMNSVAASMEQSAGNTSMVATAAEEMTATINEIAMNTEKARGISESAVSQSRSTAERMDELGKAAQDIGLVTETISDISEQTNLLALNATIEAARAGDAGKGFAVVANEIKALAMQTAEATKDIKEKIDGIQNVTGITVQDINEISQVIGDVNEIIATIATAVEEQSAATTEIANNISQASQGILEVNDSVNQSSTVVQEITRDISGVNNIASEMSSSSAKVHADAEEMARLSSKLKEIVGRFVI